MRKFGFQKSLPGILTLLLAGGGAWCAGPVRPVPIRPVPVHTGRTTLAAPSKVASVEGITEYRLANGMRVLLFPDAGKPTITVNITYLVGSRNENYGETGMAHLLEHMLFKGTPRHPDIPKELTERGTRPNGSTTWDRTNYFETFPASQENLKWALDLESDRMIHSYVGIDTKTAALKLKTEMTVVRNEYEEGENSPMGVLFKRLLGVAYDWHNYGKLPIGARSDIENVNIERLSAFFKTYYQPDNAVLLVAGKIDEPATLRMVNESFGRIPKPTRGLQKTYTEEPVQDGERQVVVRRVGDIQIALAGYHVPAGSDPDFGPIAVLAQILGDTPTGRMHKALVESGKATQVFCDPLQLKDPSYIVFGARLRGDAPLEEAKEAMLKLLEEPSNLTFTTEEVDRAKQQIQKDIDLALNDADHVGLALSEYVALGDWRLFFLDRDRVKSVTPADVERVAKAYLKPSNRSLGLFIPTPKPDRAPLPAVQDVDAMVKDYKGEKAVVQGEAFDASPKAIQARTQYFETPAGLKAALVAKKSRGGSVAFRLALHFGDETSLKGKVTAGGFAADMLMRGTLKHTRAEIANLLDKLKARIHVVGNAEGLSVSGETDRENLPRVMELVVELLKEPVFPDQEFEMLKREALTRLEQQRTDPAASGQLAFRRHMSPYPKGHPRYVNTLEERSEEVRVAKLEDVKAFHKSFYGASAGELSIVGDIDPQVTRQRILELVGDWKSPGGYTRIPQVFKEALVGSQVIETPDKANAFFVGGLNLALQDTDPDYPALLLGDFMLGGGFLNSRLATRIRQKEGLSYDVGSQLMASSLDRSGRWVGYAIFAPQNAAKLEAAFREELNRVLKDGFTAEELQAAKSGWLQDQQMGRSQDRELAGLLASELEAGRTLAYTSELELKVQSLAPDQVQAALRKYLDPNKFSVVRAGDFKNVTVTH